MFAPYQIPSQIIAQAGRHLAFLKSDVFSEGVQAALDAFKNLAPNDLAELLTTAKQTGKISRFERDSGILTVKPHGSLTLRAIPTFDFFVGNNPQSIVGQNYTTNTTARSRYIQKPQGGFAAKSSKTGGSLKTPWSMRFLVVLVK